MISILLPGILSRVFFFCLYFYYSLFHIYILFLWINNDDLSMKNKLFGGNDNES